MKATFIHGVKEIRVQEVAKPEIIEATDGLVRVVRACVCGSDLWPYRGLDDYGVAAMGHEAIGVVEELGSSAAESELAVGDLVIIPFAYSDNACPNCEYGVHTACTHGGFFGGGAAGLGCQAEYLRVPQIAGTAVAVPAGEYSEEQLADFLALTDVMGTGYHAAKAAQVRPGATVAVVGDGAVGLSAVLSAKLIGAARVIVLGSKTTSRHELARKWGADEIITERGEDAVAKLLELTDGVGADAVLECVGSDQSTDTSLAIVRAGGFVGRVGVPHTKDIPAAGTFFRNIGIHGGPAPVRAYLPELLQLTLDGEIHPGEVFDCTVQLDEIAAAYAAMDERRSIKAMVKVSELSQ
ncbi:MAG: zinc-binding dehydrogenase [Corynebacterium sp.]|nr:zinc-binding dehydrogenase [Corynebacterium sp.]